MNNDNDIECIICQDETINRSFIKYQHTCGIYDIHQSCLDDWFIKNNNSCIICRNNIISSSESESSDSSSGELIESSNLNTSYDDIETSNEYGLSIQDNSYSSYGREISYNIGNTNNKFICAILFISIFLLIIIFYFFL